MATVAVVMQATGRSVIFAVAKPVPALLAMLALMLVAGSASHAGHHLVAAALALCAAGDVLLLRDKRFVAGLAAFLCAHILILLALFGITTQTHLSVLLLYAAFGLGMYTYLRPGLGGLKGPVLLYVGVIVAMGWRAAEAVLEVWSVPAGLIFAGSLFFLLSDGILSVDRFRNPLKYGRPVVLGTYYLSLILFTIGFASLA
jgi:uncharacterized membrane protein YhhN